MKDNFNGKKAAVIGTQPGPVRRETAKENLQLAEKLLLSDDRAIAGVMSRLHEAGRYVEASRLAVEEFVRTSKSARDKMGYLQTPRSKNLADDVKRDAEQNPATPALIRATAMLINPYLQNAFRGVALARRDFDRQMQTPDFAFELLKNLRQTEHNLNMAFIYASRFERAGLYTLPLRTDIPKLKK
jgi:hypothetical protein